MPSTVETLQAEKVVVVFRLAALRVEAPAADDSAHCDDDALRTGWGHDHLGRHGVRLVLVVDDGAFRQPPHAAEQQLPRSRDQLRPAGERGVGALGKTIVQGQHVVLDGFDQPQPL